jgi:uncharacterized protein YndB with AHSA1/START domain
MTAEPSPELTPGREVRITRVFRAPREIVFRAWVDPDQIAAWWAPEECEIPRDSVEVDARDGGRIYFSMVDAARGVVHRVRFEIVDISEPNLLVLASDPEPEIGLVHPMLTRVVFEADGESTRVTVTQGPHTDEMQNGAAAGWRGSLDKLERLLRE